ncbi:MAG: PEGA domain-containing protein [Bradymonadaceae bacterium]
MDDQRVIERCAVACLAVCALLAAGPVFAADEGDKADESSEQVTSIEDLSPEKRKELANLVKKAQSTYQSGNFKQSVEVLKKAYDILPRAAFVYRMGLAYENSGKLKKAVEKYKRFLDEKPDTDKRGQVERKIAQLEKQIREQSTATVSIQTTPADATVSVGVEGEESERGETPLEVDVSPGESRIVIRKEGYESVEKNLNFEAGETYNLAISLSKSAPTEKAAAGGGDFPTVPVVLTGVGGASLIAGSIFAIQGANARSELKEVRSNSRDHSRSRAKSLASKNNTMQALTIGAGVVAAGSLGTAAVLWLTGDGERQSAGRRTEAPLGVAVAPRRGGGAAVTVSGRF